MNLDDTNNTFDEVSTIEDDSPVKPKTNPPTTEIHKADMNSLFDYKKNAFAFSGNKGGFSSWATKPAQSLLKDLDNCKHGVYFGMRNSHFEGVGESSGTILKEFEKNYKELVKVADKVGSGDLVVRALNDMYAPIEPIGKFIRDEIANPEGLDKGDWFLFVFQFLMLEFTKPLKEIYTITIKNIRIKFTLLQTIIKYLVLLEQQGHHSVVTLKDLQLKSVKTWRKNLVLNFL